jgi:hypothetical protein
VRGNQEQGKNDARQEYNPSNAEVIGQPTGERRADALQQISKRESERYAGAVRMELLSEWFDENAKRIDDYGGIAKTKTNRSNYDNPPSVEKLRVFFHSGMSRAGLPKSMCAVV